MLILSRKVNEEIVIGDSITVVISRISGNRVSIGIKAPEDVHIVRRELLPIVESFDDPPGRDKTRRASSPAKNNGNAAPHHSLVPRGAR